MERMALEAEKRRLRQEQEESRAEELTEVEHCVFMTSPAAQKQ